MLGTEFLVFLENTQSAFQLPCSLCFSSTVYGSPLLRSRKTEGIILSSHLLFLPQSNPRALPIPFYSRQFQICPSVSFSSRNLSYCALPPLLKDIPLCTLFHFAPSLFVSPKAPNFIFFIRLCLSIGLKKKHSEASHGPQEKISLLWLKDPCVIQLWPKRPSLHEHLVLFCAVLSLLSLQLLFPLFPASPTSLYLCLGCSFTSLLLFFQSQSRV